MENKRRDFLKKMGLNSLLICTGMASVNSYSMVRGVSSSPLAISSESLPLDCIYNVFSFGAKGDGQTIDTHAIQAAIDHCNEQGGGKVYLNKGCFISGTIYMKSNVTLHIEAGAILRGSDNLDDFPIISSKYPSYRGTYVTNKMLIYAEDQNDITICGRGIIDGITVDSRENPDIEKVRYADARGRNTDGFDLVDCQTARVSNCFIVSGDDGICLKSFSPDEWCQDIVIQNIQASDIESQYSCSIAGTSDYKVENIVLRNMNLNFIGGGKRDDAFITVPEREDAYPNGRMYGTLPTYGFFIRHAKNITLESIQMNFKHEDLRPALICDNVEQLDIKSFKAPGASKTPELIRLVDVRDVVISESRPASPVPVFLSVKGDKSNNIILQNNILKNAKEMFMLEKKSMEKILTEYGTIK